jgi:hypothetical protein
MDISCGFFFVSWKNTLNIPTEHNNTLNSLMLSFYYLYPKHYYTTLPNYGPFFAAKKHWIL